MTQAELNRLCRKWQKRLRLEDWRIKVYRAAGLTQWGKISPDRAAKTAIIYIRDQDKTPLGTFDEDSGIDGEFAQDEETVLVHELMHLHTWPFDKTEEGTEGAIAVEVCVNLVAEALVALDREAS